MRKYPFLSIIVPTYNRPHALVRCLEALAKQTYPRAQMEIIVVDDGGGSIQNPGVYHRLQNTGACLLQQPNGGPASARNYGAREARGTFIAFTDDDCAPERDWLRILARDALEYPNDMFGGFTDNALTDNPYAEASQCLISYLYHYYNSNSPSGPRFFTSNNMLVNRDSFLQLGGFNSSFQQAAGEDRDLCRRWIDSGRSMHFVPDARVKHFHDLNLRSFWLQHFNYGRAAHAYHSVHSEASALAQREPLRFYLDLIRYPYGVSDGSAALFGSFLMLVSQIANASGYGFESFVRAKRR